MLSNPPYGKSWKKDLEAMGGKEGMRDPRFKISHADEELLAHHPLQRRPNAVPGQHGLQDEPQDTLGSRIAEVHNGSSLFTGDAGQGESNIRRWIIENDWLEAIVALPLNLFYNTGIATYIWVLTNQKPEHRKGKVQLIDASSGSSRCGKPWQEELRAVGGRYPTDLDTYLDFKETEQSKIFPNAALAIGK